ncbi:geranylgeranyl diphosphate synthase type II [Arthrobacter roseus]|nr:geranylgeranyl diphosphate synthase type II [Arthrobacter roseus]
MVMTPYVHLGGSNLNAAAYVGAAFELLHTALIVHDDVIDLDFIRRGRDNVSGSYRHRAAAAGAKADTARHHGLSAGVIAGDLALANAFVVLDGAEASPDLKITLREILEEAVFASAAGEIIDLDFSLGSHRGTLDDIIQMAGLKTASYSFECPLRAGATLAGASPDVVTAVGDFGRDIGTAYQLVDDWLGVFGDEALTGKSIVSDLREGKGTVLIAVARESSDWEELSFLLGSPDLSVAQADRARTILRDCGAQDYALETAQRFADRAHSYLSSGIFPPQLQSALEPIVFDAVHRVR